MNVKFYNMVKLSHHLLELKDRRLLNKIQTRDFPLEEFVTHLLGQTLSIFRIKHPTSSSALDFTRKW